ncbi:aldo/keto reductase [Burkholderia cenocepacia]|nr:aldo/keto reductase [Burkholderia cenocepacia]MBR8174016.1 aldo/keto reductase [Burkholderia cenocepacia]
MFNAIGDTGFREVVDEAWKIGLRYFDTAPLYADGLSEHRFGAALEGRPRHEYVLSTKTGRWKEGDGNRYDYSYFGTMQSIEESMRRLKTTYIDIVFIHDLIRALHGEQFEERFEEAMSGAYRALTDLKRLGKVKAIGAALREPDVCERFARSGQFDCFMLAGGHTLLQHAAMSSLLPLCMEKKISVLVASPFNTGILATGAKEDARYEYRPAKDTPGIVDRVRKLEEIGLEFDVPLPSAALQYPLRHPAVVSVVAGHQSTREVRENIALLTRSIPDDYWLALGDSGLIPKSAVIPFR